MSNDRRFDEVMIVNPYDPANAAGEGARVMQFHYAQPPGYGYYAGATPYGYYAQPPGYGAWGGPEPCGMSGYAQYEPMGGYAQPPGYGYYAADPYGYYAEPPDVGEWGEPEVYGAPSGYAQYEPVSGYAQSQEFSHFEPVGYYADEYPVGNYAGAPEMVGWGGPMGYYGEPPFEGYVRETPPTFNPGCPMPTNVAGFGEPPLEGYVHPADVSPTCDNFTPQPGATTGVPETFRPLW
jgi:hypothetical protein